MDIQLSHYLLLSAVLFSIGVAGVLTRKNLIVVFMALELMMNAVNLSFVAIARQMGDAAGQLIVFFVICVAAAEVAVGLAILIALWRHKNSVNIDTLTMMKW
jgi:NADH-quinone oxidoreductase subunit K